MQLIVLGMHRSGTSMLARMINLMGAYFGAEGTSTGANKENPKGFWERRDVRVLNDDVLFSMGCDWDRISTLDLSRVPPAMERDFDARAFRIVLDLDAHRPWLLKEPRLCLLLPLWRRVLELPICIHIVRHPVEVASSLRTRNGIPLAAGLALWEQYNRLALRAADGLPIITVQHRKLMMTPDAAAEELFDGLQAAGVVGLRKPTSQELTAFVRQDLYREREGSPGFPNAGASQCRLFEQMANGRYTRRMLEGTLSAKQSKALQAYESSLPPFSKKPSEEDQREARRRIETEMMEQLKTEIETRSLEHATLKGQFGVLKEWATAAEAARVEVMELLRQKQAESTALAEQLAASKQELSATEQLLERTRADSGADSRQKEAEIDQIKSDLARLMTESRAVEMTLRAEVERMVEASKVIESSLRSELEEAVAAAEEQKVETLSLQAECHRLSLESKALESGHQSELEEVVAAAEERRTRALSEQAEHHRLSLDNARRAQEELQARFHRSSREIAKLSRRLIQLEEVESKMQRDHDALHIEIGRHVEEHAAAIARKCSEDDAFLKCIDQANKKIASLKSEVKHTKAENHRIIAELAASKISSEKLALQCSEVRQALNDLLSSHSWRWSAPIRVVSRMLRGRGPRHVHSADGNAMTLLRDSSLFDVGWYLKQYPDVSAQKMDPILHYLSHGASEGRDPSPCFSTRGYLVRNPDIVENGMNPLVHYLRYGKDEGRAIGFPEKKKT